MVNIIFFHGKVDVWNCSYTFSETMHLNGDCTIKKRFLIRAERGQPSEGLSHFFYSFE